MTASQKHLKYILNKIGYFWQRKVCYIDTVKNNRGRSNAAFCIGENMDNTIKFTETPGKCRICDQWDTRRRACKLKECAFKGMRLIERERLVANKKK